jgi:hypothetical protein
MRYFTCCGPECRGGICRHATAPSRHLAAWVGLVPQQLPCEDRKALMGISKRVNQHLRSRLGRNQSPVKYLAVTGYRRSADGPTALPIFRLTGISPAKTGIIVGRSFRYIRPSESPRRAIRVLLQASSVGGWKWRGGHSQRQVSGCSFFLESRQSAGIGLGACHRSDQKYWNNVQDESSEQ